MTNEERLKRGYGKPATYFLLMKGPRWIRAYPYTKWDDQYHAAVIVRLNEDGTGTVLKDRYHEDKSPWSKDDMIMVALKAETI